MPRMLLETIGFPDLSDIAFRFELTKIRLGPGWAAQVVRVASQHARVAGSSLDQGTYKNQPMTS